MLTDESEKLNSEMPSVSSQNATTDAVASSQDATTDAAAGSQGAATVTAAADAATSGQDTAVAATDAVASSQGATTTIAATTVANATAGNQDAAAKLLLSANSGLKPDLSRPLYRFVKRSFDIVASGAAIVVLLVPGAILSAIICAKSPGASPLYSQLRVGRLKKDGTYKLFRMWKFRSMQPHADALLEELKDRNEADGPLFKIKDDPRIIPGVGAFIRRHSIDELAQLINVFKGDMSLVGPRPGLPVEVALYDERAKRRLTVKPGCGGAWQAGPRSDSAFEEMVDLDLDYIRRRSVAHDLGLVLGTVRTMIRGGGELTKSLPFLCAAGC